MQTFLPSTNFEQSAKWLDNQRLGKQRVETLQILKALTNSDYGWQSHPAVKMWRGYLPALVDYGLTVCNEWTNRGYKDTCYNKIREYFSEYSIMVIPPWLTESFASNHRAVLLGKALEAYQIATPDKIERAIKVLRWYKSLNWPESPAQRVEGKWPYGWLV